MLYPIELRLRVPGTGKAGSVIVWVPNRDVKRARTRAHRTTRSSDELIPGKIGRVSVTLGQLAKHIGAELVGDPSRTVDSVASIDVAGASQVAFLSNPRYAKYLETTSAAAVIVKPQVTSDHVPLLRM